ncbi:MAG: hypothetical protein ACKV2V_12105 [Blastocatellia bacterium]
MNLSGSEGHQQPRHDRRGFLRHAALAAAGSHMAPASVFTAPPKKRVAAIVTEYRYYSHADVIIGRMLDGYTPNNTRVEPRTSIVSMYTDQVPEKDLSRAAAAKHGFKIYPTIAEALTMGGDKLAVDAVLLIGEHGQYPDNEKGQKLYPRYELFRQITDVFRRTGRSVPLFTDKHLSYSWAKAREMYELSHALKFPMMAGSSIPVTVRVPALSLAPGANLENAVGVGYAGLDSYGFHALEGLQCMLERRRGAETGIAAVETLSGDAVWRWRDSARGRWSGPLLDAALGCLRQPRPGPIEQQAKDVTLFRLEYRDGFQAVVYMLGQYIDDIMFAARVKGQTAPMATRFDLTRRALPHFDGLVDFIEQFFVTGKPLYPVERTLLTTGALEALLDAKHQGKRIETPHLNVRYRAPRRDYHEYA